MSSSDQSRSNTGAPEAGSGGPVAIVGIGASAGGLRPLQTLLEAVPADTGMAFVVVMHLDPNRASGLPDVLQSRTGMAVVQVTEKTKVKPNHVYVIPPNKRLLAADHSLELADFEEPRGKRVPVDQLFRSLAEVHSDRVFGIILSGSGTDGAVGMKQIKEKGGFLMAQSPEEAEFESMPQAAIATGLVDLVLTAEEMARHLADYVKQPALIQRTEKRVAQEPEAFQEILSHLHSQVGHDFSQYKQPTLVRRLGRRMQVNRVHRLNDYLDVVREKEGETAALFRDLLIGVTTFFRDNAAWEALADKVVPRIFEEKQQGDTVRAWVSGCSSGEEAFSLAILLLEHAERVQSGVNVQVFGSDIDERGLDTAREAVFPEGIEADVSEERLRRFFSREENHYRAKKELRESVTFATHDLLRDPPFSRLDLITCRNLLIYLERDVHQRVFEIFHYALRPGGLLFLGSSESPGDSPLFQTIDSSQHLYQVRKRPGEVPHLPTLPLKVRERPRQEGRKPQEREPTSEAGLHRTMLEHYAPPSLLVGESFRVIHLSESAGRYFNPAGGKLSHDVTSLVRQELRFELRRALQAAFDQEKDSVTGAAWVKFNGEPIAVSMVVRHNPKRHDSERLALVIFLEGVEARAPAAESPSDDRDEIVGRLEEELQETRRQLQKTIEESDSTHEELHAANEELQSMNEEYRSTTEELETSKEELESVNEELNTVNNELKSKLDEVSQAHNDLQNLMTATDIGTLFLDRGLCIKRYTPRICDLFNIMPGDLGRPIGHFTHAFEYDELISTSEKVLDDLRPREAEIQGKDGRWYLMRLRPYRTVDDRIEGIVITFVDITDRREAEESLRRSEERQRILLENVREYAIFTMDTDRRITTWNTGAERIFGYKADEAIGQTADIIFTDDDRRAGAPQEEMGEAAQNGEASDDRLHRCRDGSTFWATGILAALYDTDGSLRGYAKVLRDNTDRKEAEDRLRRLNESLEERVKERTEQVRSLASTLTMAEQEERRRISQILHDNLQQLLYGVQMKLNLVLRSADKGDTAGLKKYADDACASIRDAIRTTRQLTVDFSPPVLKGEGLTAALQWLVSMMAEAHNLKVTLVADETFPIPDEDMRVLLFHAVRELLFNTAKHGKTDRARIALHRKDGSLTIDVSDEGKGFDVAKAEGHGSGLGLFAIRERMRLFGGQMTIHSSSGQGTQIHIDMPIEPEETLNEKQQ